MSLAGYVDSDYAGDLDKRRSLTGYVFTVGGCAVSWKATLQDAVAQSTTEAEYMAIAEADQMFHERTKHIDIKYHAIRDVVAKGKVKQEDRSAFLRRRVEQEAPVAEQETPVAEPTPPVAEGEHFGWSSSDDKGKINLEDDEDTTTASDEDEVLEWQAEEEEQEEFLEEQEVLLTSFATNTRKIESAEIFAAAAAVADTIFIPDDDE
ncbi:hypothetical protein QYE76_008771 [Lolium multiflorum]|uniref:Uncharacterized protein n=1 Tax=Lolium multiflorum TaxID=4521 RepID=A0AAD8X2Y7_LOLMU|nr:hypothetical protein QYE76_008771 [Lolium multiflorum]